MAKVQLDTVNSDSSEFVIWLKQAKITTKVIDECGPVVVGQSSNTRVVKRRYK